MVILAFATIYLVWGSTYFFIQMGVQHMPALILGAIRFIASGLIMLLYCLYRKEHVFLPTQMKYAAITGILMLFIGTGAVIWAEKSLPSSLVAVLVASRRFGSLCSTNRIGKKISTTLKHLWVLQSDSWV